MHSCEYVKHLQELKDVRLEVFLELGALIDAKALAFMKTLLQNWLSWDSMVLNERSSFFNLK